MPPRGCPKAEGRTEAVQALAVPVHTSSRWEKCSAATCAKTQEAWSPLFWDFIAETLP